MLNIINEDETINRGVSAPGPYLLTLEEAYSYLQIFIDTLMRLECTLPLQPENTGLAESAMNANRGMSYANDPNIDEEELRQWANIKKYQKIFADAGGTLRF